MRVHSIFLHLMRSLSECPLWSTLRVRPSHRVFYPWGVRRIGGILHIGMQCVRRQAGLTECWWHSAMCDCVRSMGSNCCGQRGMRPRCIGLNGSCGISKPTTCLMLERLLTMRVQQSAIRPLCIGYTGPAGRSKPTKCCKVQQHRNQAWWKLVSTWAVKGWEGGFKKERKRCQTLKACPLLKGLKQKRPRGRRFNQD